MGGNLFKTTATVISVAEKIKKGIFLENFYYSDIHDSLFKES